MDYYELYFTYASSTVEPAIISDLLAAELAEAGFDSFVPEAEGLRAYLPADRYRQEEVEQRLRDFPLAGIQFHTTQTHIPAKDWNEEWEKHYFQPVRIGQRCLLRAPFHPVETGFEYELVIHPKMAFGTGHHETTRLMLDAILDMPLEGSAVLDMGCGTAVLAILAAKKGATPVVAIDIDEWAYRNALENCLLNNTPQVRVIRGGAEEIPGDIAFDCIFANITRNVLLNDLRQYASSLKPGGWLLASGFHTEDIPLLESGCRHNRLEKLSTGEHNHWAILKTVKR
ncbi:MAG: 50S ribosomal protein L11 methyltransferase [Tannerella sp.]|jgi:ribosomal protein L11 methyltransferase|nr:50S ribosomal protein L11 methyltransferase [Tannerella sp.]